MEKQGSVWPFYNIGVSVEWLLLKPTMPVNQKASLTPLCFGSPTGANEAATRRHKVEVSQRQWIHTLIHQWDCMRHFGLYLVIYGPC
jgi:hypothetical protein